MERDGRKPNWLGGIRLLVKRWSKRILAMKNMTLNLQTRSPYSSLLTQALISHTFQHRRKASLKGLSSIPPLLQVRKFNYSNHNLPKSPLNFSLIPPIFYLYHWRHYSPFNPIPIFCKSTSLLGTHSIHFLVAINLWNSLPAHTSMPRHSSPHPILISNII